MEPLRAMEERLSALLLPVTSDDATTTGKRGLGLGQNVGVDLLVSLAALSAGFFLVRDPGMSRKRQAWILSALTSLPAATLSLPHVLRLLRHGFAEAERFVFKDDRLARFLCCFFAAFLLLDLGLGCTYVRAEEGCMRCMHAPPPKSHPPPTPTNPHAKPVRYYRDQIQLLSGWVHHTLYLALMAWALTSHFTCGFALFLPLELPTFILALGSIYPERRSDLLFGAAFFCTRVCYHALLLQRILRMADSPVPVWIPTLLAFGLHCWWMALWCRSYARRRLLLERGKSSVLVVPPSPAGAGMSPTSMGAAARARAAGPGAGDGDRDGKDS